MGPRASAMPGVIGFELALPLAAPASGGRGSFARGRAPLATVAALAVLVLSGVP